MSRWTRRHMRKSTRARSGSDRRKFEDRSNFIRIVQEAIYFYPVNKRPREAVIKNRRNTNDNRSEPAMAVRSKVIEAIQQIAKEQHVALPALSDELSLHETGFASSPFPTLVARLEDETAVDPSPIPEDAASPATVGDFVRA